LGFCLVGLVGSIGGFLSIRETALREATALAWHSRSVKGAFLVWQEEEGLLLFSATFKMAAVAFSYPTPVAQELVGSGCFKGILLAALREGGSDGAGALPEDAWAVAVKFWAGPLTEIQATYTGLFDAGYPQPPCPPYAGFYLPGGTSFPGPRPALFGELQDRYRRWGLDPAGELPDHVAVELEFLHFLCSRRLEALRRGDVALEDALSRDQAWMLAHLRDWLPAFGKQLRELESACFWALTAGVVRALVDHEENIVKNAKG
ncbi:TorD/DmsD family molecular chaperone, partial [Thermodesulfitimonas sp.]